MAGMFRIFERGNFTTVPLKLLNIEVLNEDRSIQCGYTEVHAEG
jgi:hypothetical protein